MITVIPFALLIYLQIFLDKLFKSLQEKINYIKIRNNYINNNVSNEDLTFGFC